MAQRFLNGLIVIGVNLVGGHDNDVGRGGETFGRNTFSRLKAVDQQKIFETVFVDIGLNKRLLVNNFGWFRRYLLRKRQARRQE